MSILNWFLKSRQKRAKLKDKSQKIPYANFKRLTKTGKVRATKHSKEEGRFKVGKEVYDVKDISKNAKKVYIYLARIADSKGYCFPFIKTIAKRCNVSPSTVNKVLKELEAKGLIKKVARRVSRRGGSSNIFQVLTRE